MPRTFLFFLFFWAILGPSCTYASFSKEIWPKWQVNNPISTEFIDHSQWQRFLDCCVVTNAEGINLINYPHLTNDHHILLDSYLKKMSAIDINKYNRKEQLAYWINLYNALTVKVISDAYPIPNVLELNISPGLFSIGPWDAPLIKVNQINLSLNQILNRILRPTWNDPRILYALNNGTIGSPNLSKNAFLGNTIEQQLTEATENYINSKRGLLVIEGKLVISRVYEWYAQDFGSDAEDLLQHLRQFANEPQRSQLKHVTHISSYTYNWHLNSTIRDHK